MIHRKNKRKKTLSKTYTPFLMVEKEILMLFESKIFPIKIEGTGFSDKVLDHYNLKILTPKQMIQRLPIALA